MPKKLKTLKGHFLAAAPSLLDPNFFRTVVLIFEHGAEGAAGVVINRAMDATISEIAEQVFDEPFVWDKPIYLGGPVPGPLMILHGEADLADQEVLPGVYSTVEADKVREVLRRRAEPSIIVANYAGWGPGQLEAEMAEESWITAPASADQLFGDEPDDLWDQVAALSEDELDLAEFLGVPMVPEDPSLN
jgi:putative transcriptional regulator